MCTNFYVILYDIMHMQKLIYGFHMSLHLWFTGQSFSSYKIIIGLMGAILSAVIIAVLYKSLYRFVVFLHGILQNVSIIKVNNIFLEV